MLTWAQIKPLIRGLVSPVFLEMGFESPGVCMWRHREKFIDVVEFSVKRAYDIHVFFGCSPRRKGSHNPRPWECAFSTQPSLSLGVNPELLSFGANEERQRENLVRLADQLREPALQWFAHFASVATARFALEQNEVFGPRHVYGGMPGSMAYSQIAAALNAIEINEQ
jgi:hypothetical protein